MMAVRNQVNQRLFGYEYPACVRRPGRHWACCPAYGLCRMFCPVNASSVVRRLGEGTFAIAYQHRINEPQQGTYEETEEDNATASISEIERRMLKGSTGRQGMER